MKNNRIAWIDICRGVGILTVVYAHGLSADKFRFIFYAFHIPLFFFLSGITFRHKQHENILISLRKAVKSILLPYFLFALLGYGFWLILNIHRFSLEGFMQIIINIVYGNGSGKQFFYNAVLWFLPCLFITRYLFTLITYFTTKSKSIILILILASVISYLGGTFFPELKLPFGFETALSGVIFFGLGYLYHGHENLQKWIQDNRFILGVIFLNLLLVIATWNFLITGHQIDMRINRINNHLLFYLGAISGIGMCLSLSYIIRENKILQFLGKNSLPFFVFHLMIFSYISKILMLWINPATISQYRNLFFAPLYSLISILIISSCLYLYRKTIHNRSKNYAI